MDALKNCLGQGINAVSKHCLDILARDGDDPTTTVFEGPGYDIPYYQLYRKDPFIKLDNLRGSIGLNPLGYGLRLGGFAIFQRQTALNSDRNVAATYLDDNLLARVRSILANKEIVIKEI